MTNNKERVTDLTKEEKKFVHFYNGEGSYTICYDLYGSEQVVGVEEKESLAILICDRLNNILNTAMQQYADQQVRKEQIKILEEIKDSCELRPDYLIEDINQKITELK